MVTDCCHCWGRQDWAFLVSIVPLYKNTFQPRQQFMDIIMPGRLICNCWCECTDYVQGTSEYCDTCRRTCQSYYVILWLPSTRLLLNPFSWGRHPRCLFWTSFSRASLGSLPLSSSYWLVSSALMPASCASAWLLCTLANGPFSLFGYG